MAQFLTFIHAILLYYGVIMGLNHAKFSEYMVACFRAQYPGRLDNTQNQARKAVRTNHELDRLCGLAGNFP